MRCVGRAMDQPRRPSSKTPDIVPMRKLAVGTISTLLRVRLLLSRPRPAPIAPELGFTHELTSGDRHHIFTSIAVPYMKATPKASPAMTGHDRRAAVPRPSVLAR